MSSRAGTQTWKVSQAVRTSIDMERGGNIHTDFLFPNLIYRYHGFIDNPYPLPNDDDERERLDALHRCYRTLIGTNIVPPIRRKPTQLSLSLLIQKLSVVDVGTGTGCWVLEVADQYPGAMVYGIDISPIQPTLVPGNAEFIVMDLTRGLDFDDGSTDFVHSRYAIIGNNHLMQGCPCWG